MATAELKRKLAPGVRVLLVQNLKGRCRKLRWVIRQTARDCVFGGPDIQDESYLTWPKKGELFPCIGGFVIAKDGQVQAKYQWVDGSPNTLEEYEAGIVVDPKPLLRLVTEEQARNRDLVREIHEVLDDPDPEPYLDMGSRYLPCPGCERPMWLCECLSDAEWWRLKQAGF